jgi:hypothetical protein
MSYDDHIHDVCKQLSKRLGLLKRICPYLRKEQKQINISNEDIKPKLLYGNAIWSCCSKECTNRIIEDAKTARIIFNTDRTIRSKMLYSCLKWLPFTDVSFIRRSAIVYKCLAQLSFLY